ncbi:MAG: hypothetical protein QOF58_1563 [Pseudonocardiales bacterium]|nr:hypothetical protein [Pseudonocardiales bacterium]
MMYPQVWMIDPTGAKRGILPYRSLAAVEKFLAVGTFRVEAELTEANARAAAAGWRLAIMLGSSPIMAGQLTEPEMSYGQESGGRIVPTITYVGEDDMGWLRDRLAYPVPANALSAQTNAYDIRTDDASTVILGYVNDNAGPGAQVARRVPGLILDPDPVAGGTVTGRARFEKVLPLCAELADGAAIGFRVVSDTTTVKRFQVFVPRDLRGPARFSTGLRNLAMLKWRLNAPTATTIIGGGRGEETARSFISQTNATETTAWGGRREDFYDFRSASGTDSNAELTEGTARKLNESASTEQVQFLPIDTEALKYGRDYGLGDRVTVGVFGTQVTVQATIREVEHRVTKADGYRVLPRAGDIGASGATRQRSILDAAVARLSNLERR